MMNSYRGLPFCLSAVLTAFSPESVSDAYSLRTGIAAAKEQGYGAIEFFYEGSEKERIADDLRSSGLRSVFLPSYYLKTKQLDLGSPNNSNRARALQEMKRYIDDARYFGSEGVMFASGVCPESNDIVKTLNILEESICELCEYAVDGSAPLRVSIESFNDNGEPYYLLGPTTRSTLFAKTIRQKYNNYGMTIDLSHLMQLGENAVSSFLIADPVCDHIHIANSTNTRGHAMFGDKHLCLDDPDGDLTPILLKEFLNTILHVRGQKTYENDLFLGLEIINRGEEKPEETMLSAKDIIDRIVTEIEGCQNKSHR